MQAEGSDVKNLGAFPPWQEDLPTVKWSKDDKKVCWWNDVLSFVLQMKSCLLHLEKACFMSLWRFLSHQIAVLFYLTLGDTHAQSDKKIAPSLFSVIIWFWIVKLWIQTIEVHRSIICKAKHCCYIQPRQFLICQGRQDCSIYVPLPSSYVNTPLYKWGRV